MLRLGLFSAMKQPLDYLDTWKNKLPVIKYSIRRYHRIDVRLIALIDRLLSCTVRNEC